MKNLTNTIVLVSTSLTLTACFGGGSSGGSALPSAAQPAVPTNPLPSQGIMEAAGCTVTQLSNGIQFSCNGTTGIVYNGQDGAVGATGSTGATGSAGAVGAGCTSAAAANGVNITCGATITFVANGSNGTNGTGCSTASASGGVNVTCGGVTTFVANGTDGINGAGSSGMDVYDQNGIHKSEFTFLAGDLTMGVGVHAYLLSKTHGVTVPYQSTGLIWGYSTVRYEFANCTGKAYAQNNGTAANGIWRYDRSAASLPDLYFKTIVGSKRSFTTLSVLGPDGTCTTTAATGLTWIEIQPYTLPAEIPASMNLPLMLRPAL